MSVVGVGTDLVGVPRFERALHRTPGLLPRLFTDAERVTRSGRPRRAHSLAARFAAKEAAAKALGVPRGWGWHDTEVVSGPNGRPLLRITGSLAAAAGEQGVTGWHVTLTHDADLASAVVIAEAAGGGETARAAGGGETARAAGGGETARAAGGGETARAAGGGS